VLVLKLTTAIGCIEQAQRLASGFRSTVHKSDFTSAILVVRDWATVLRLDKTYAVNCQMAFGQPCTLMSRTWAQAPARGRFLRFYTGFD